MAPSSPAMKIPFNAELALGFFWIEFLRATMLLPVPKKVIETHFCFLPTECVLWVLPQISFGFFSFPPPRSGSKHSGKLLCCSFHVFRYSCFMLYMKSFIKKYRNIGTINLSSFSNLWKLRHKKYRTEYKVMRPMSLIPNSLHADTCVKL